MARRIGEELVERGLIDARQLKRALDAQLIFGGHLGTNLIELGFVDEMALVETLGNLLNLNHATLDMLTDIPPSVIHTISRELAEKHQIVPIKLEGSTLHVAVINPRNLGSLSRRTGCKIVPRVAPEIRVFEALEKYYGVPRRARYITICNELDRQIERVRGNERAAAGEPAAVEESPIIGSEDDPIDWEAQYGRSWRDVVDEPEIDPHDGSGELDGVVDRLCRADNAAEVSAAVLDYAAQHMAGTILFTVKASAASIWDARGLDLDPGRAAKLRFPLLSGSIFSVLRGNEFYRGKVPDSPGCRCFYASLGIEPPAELFLAPIHLNDRLVSVFYGDSGKDGSLDGATDVYIDLVEKLALALNMLILKMKIRAV